jgi:hypothetical protein
MMLDECVGLLSTIETKQTVRMTDRSPGARQRDGLDLLPFWLGYWAGLVLIFLSRQEIGCRATLTKFLSHS